jgi:hypothetical protein
MHGSIAPLHVTAVALYIRRLHHSRFSRKATSIANLDHRWLRREDISIANLDHPRSSVVKTSALRILITLGPLS